MGVRVTSWWSSPSMLKALASHVRLTVRLLREPAVGLVLKTLPVAAGLYVISPLDLVPDVLPVLGQLDDLTMLIVALQSFQRLCPDEVVDFHRRAIASRRPYSPVPPAGVTIDAEFRHEDQPR
jgi:uncharacterized membrane protein YkvA (DUF1232 family)